MQLSILPICETYFEKFYKHFGHENVELLLKYTDFFVITIKAADIFEGLYNLKYSVDFGNINRKV